MVGTTRKASSIDIWEPDFGTSTDFSEQLMYSAVRGYASQPNARGALADKFASATKSMMAINTSVKPLYSTPSALPEDDIVARLTLAARIFNAGLGVRVISVIRSDGRVGTGTLGGGITGTAISARVVLLIMIGTTS